jgi:hypothetical protein
MHDAALAADVLLLLLMTHGAQTPPSLKKMCAVVDTAAGGGSTKGHSGFAIVVAAGAAECSPVIVCIQAPQEGCGHCAPVEIYVAIVRKHLGQQDAHNM